MRQNPASKNQQLIWRIAQFITKQLLKASLLPHFCPVINKTPKHKTIQPKQLIMKKVSYYLFALLATITLATSCKKDNHETRDTSTDTPKTEIPDAYVGKWIAGNFNPAHF